MNALLERLLLRVEYKAGDVVWTPEGWRGEVIETNRHDAGVLLHVRGSGHDGWFWADDCERAQEV